MRPVALVGLSVVIGGLLGWHARGERLVAAQGHTPITLTRLYTGSDGQTHAQKVDIKMLPAAAGGELSDPVKVREVQFRRIPPGFFRDWHPVSRRQYTVTLSGRGEVELPSGEKIRSGPGDVKLAEDLTGKGHITRNVGSEDWILLYVSLDEK